MQLQTSDLKIQLWNPVIPCENDCRSCTRKNCFRLTLDEDRLHFPQTFYNPTMFFAGLMPNIHCWPEDITYRVFELIRSVSKHSFLFLSTDPATFEGIDWPVNTGQGLHITGRETQIEQEKLFREMSEYPLPFLVIDPLAGPIKEYIYKFKVVIVGMVSDSGSIKQQKEWIESVNQYDWQRIIVWKKNIDTYETNLMDVLS